MGRAIDVRYVPVPIHAVQGATGERLKETQAINKSLSSLADVIVALGTYGAPAEVRFRSHSADLLSGEFGSLSSQLTRTRTCRTATRS